MPSDSRPFQRRALGPLVSIPPALHIPDPGGCCLICLTFGVVFEAEAG